MPYTSMDIQEVARLLGLDARVAQKMAERGQLPCRKVGGEFLFNRAEVLEWLGRQVGTLAYGSLVEVDQAFSRHREQEPEGEVVTELVRPEGVSVALHARTKGSVLKELVALAERTGLLWDSEGLLAALQEREDLCSTALEGGVAIPHPRRPMAHSIEESFVIIARTAGGIPFGAPDGKLTDLFFMTCSQDDRHHLHVLARLARLIREESLVDALRAAKDAETIVELVREAEGDMRS